MDLGLKGRAAIVGGASRGIGYAAAHALATEGASVTIVARNADDIERAAESLRRDTATESVLPIAADMADPDNIRSVVEQSRERWGRTDIVVNNIGGPPPGSLLDFTNDQWQLAFDLNFNSARRLNELVLPDMRARGFGRIVSVLSTTIKEPTAQLGLSTVARSALAAYAKLLALEVAADGITVNNVLPGSTETERLRSLVEAQAKAAGRTVEEQRELRLSSIPMQRFARPEEIGGFVAFLASERAAFLTGQHIAVEGGQLRGVW